MHSSRRALALSLLLSSIAAGCSDDTTEEGSSGFDAWIDEIAVDDQRIGCDL